MFPVLEIGNISISTFGIFLAAGVLLGVFLVWRVARAWDLSEERTLDLTLLTILGGILGARIYFILEHFQLFGTSFTRWLNVQKYAGFSFWGAVFWGFLTLRFFAKKFKINFWQALDFASVGLLGGLIFESMGCFLGGCAVGTASKLFFTVPMVGSVGSRIPVQLFETILFYILFSRMWKAVLHFHIPGTIAAASLFYIGLIMSVLSPWRADHHDLFLDLILSLVGVVLFYRVTKRQIMSDTKVVGVFLLDILRKREVRKKVLLSLRRSWYNTSVNFKWNLKALYKFLRRINVRFSHKDSRYY